MTNVSNDALRDAMAAKQDQNNISGGSNPNTDTLSDTNGNNMPSGGSDDSGSFSKGDLGKTIGGTMGGPVGEKLGQELGSKLDKSGNNGSDNGGQDKPINPLKPQDMLKDTVKSGLNDPKTSLEKPVNNGNQDDTVPDDNKLVTTGNKDLDKAIDKGGKVARQAVRAVASPVASGAAQVAAPLLLMQKIIAALKAAWAAVVKAAVTVGKSIVAGAKFALSLVTGSGALAKASIAAGAAALKASFIAAPVATSVMATSVIGLGGVGTYAGVTTLIQYNETQRIMRLEEELCGVSDSDTDTRSDSEKASEIADASGGDWTVEGSESYKLAKELFKVLTEEYGLSGTSAAGWIGNVQAESGFNMKAVEAENGQNYSGRGYGLFQFTPGEKYLNSTFYKKDASMEEEVRNQVAFIFDSEFKNGAYRAYLPNAQEWFGLSGVDSIDDLLDNDNVENAMLIFFSVYERGDVAQMHRDRRLGAAQKANELFNKDNVKADKSKWKVDSTDSAGSAGEAASASSTNSKEETDPCEDLRGGSSKKKKKSSGELGKAATKDVQKALEELKKDVDAGRAIGNGECFALVSQFIYYLSGHNISAGVTSGSMLPVVDASDQVSAKSIGKTYDFAGHGYSVKFNASIEDIQVGDIVNTGATDGNPYGHTVVIAKVNGDGTFLIYEQNMYGKRYATANTREVAGPGWGEITSIVRYNGKK